MAKKTVKKQPLKAAAKAAVKTVAKAAKKIVKKVTESAKAKPVKSAPKKEEKASKAKPVPVAKKTDERKVKAKEAKAPAVMPEKAKPMAVFGKAKTKPAKEEVAVELSEDVETETVEVEAPLKVEKEKAPKKKSAAAKKKEKLEIDSNIKWGDLYEKYKQIKPVNYSMKDAFEANQPIQHKILGWGWVISSENDRLEVLFKDGKKILISNYKS